MRCRLFPWELRVHDTWRQMQAGSTEHSWGYMGGEEAAMNNLKRNCFISQAFILCYIHLSPNWSGSHQLGVSTQGWKPNPTNKCCLMLTDKNEGRKGRYVSQHCSLWYYLMLKHREPHGSESDPNRSPFKRHSLPKLYASQKNSVTRGRAQKGVENAMLVHANSPSQLWSLRLESLISFG